MLLALRQRMHVLIENHHNHHHGMVISNGGDDKWSSRIKLHLVFVCCWVLLASWQRGRQVSRYCVVRGTAHTCLHFYFDGDLISIMILWGFWWVCCTGDCTQIVIISFSFLMIFDECFVRGTAHKFLYFYFDGNFLWFFMSVYCI